MSDTTVNSMNFHLQKLETKSDLRMSRAMKEAIVKVSETQNMTAADYKRLAISERLQRDLVETA